MLFRHFEEKAEELEELKRELQGRVEELEEENDLSKKQLLMESEAKSKLRQETSRLTAENMVCVETVSHSVCEYIHILSYKFCFPFRTLKSSSTRKTD